MYKRILVPLDGSEIAEQALTLACLIAKEENAQVILLRVNEYPLSIYAGVDLFSELHPEVYKDIHSKEDVICQKNEDYLNRVVSKIKEMNLEGTTAIKDGPVVESILDTIDQEHIDLVIISAHGIGEGNPWWIGSVADRVMREAVVPVILFRPTLSLDSVNNSDHLAQNQNAYKINRDNLTKTVMMNER